MIRLAVPAEAGTTTVTPSGGFTAHPDGFEVEDTDKPHHQKSQTSG